MFPKSVFTMAIACTVAFATAQDATSIKEMVQRSLQSVDMDKVLSAIHPNDYTLYDLNWNVAFDVWDSTSVTEVFAVDGASNTTDLHMYVWDYDGENNLEPIEKLTIFNLKAPLLPNPDGDLISDENPTIVFADSMHNEFVNEETKEFELALVVYLYTHPNGQMERFQILLNGNNQNPPLGLIPFAENRFYYDQNDRLAGLASYFVDYYTLVLSLEDSVALEYDGQGRVAVEREFFPNDGDEIIETTETRYDAQSRYLNQVSRTMLGDSLIVQDSIVRDYPNTTDFNDTQYFFNMGTQSYTLTLVTSFQQINDTVWRETDLVPQGGGGLMPVYDFTVISDEQQRITSITERSQFSQGPLENDTREVYVYPATSQTLDQQSGPEFSLGILPGQGVRVISESLDLKSADLITTNGIEMSRRAMISGQEVIRLSGMPAGIYFLRLHHSTGTSVQGFYWPG